MNVHEYRGKQILRRYGVNTPRGMPCLSVAEADQAARELGGKVWVVKAQIHAGGRGKGGGGKAAKSLQEVHEYASQLLGMRLVTHQTGPGGRVVKRLLVEEGADIRSEFYIGMVVDRATQRVTLIVSSEGGMEIEEVAARTPEKIHKLAIDPVNGLRDAEADDIGRRIGIPESAVAEGRKAMQGLYRAFVHSDASLAEINPLALSGDGPHSQKKGRIGVVSRSGTLTYEAVGQITDLGESTCVGIGGDPVNGLKHLDVMQMFNDDPETDAVVMVGEIGGDDEEVCARWIKNNMTKPFVGFIASVTAPPGKRMGHAGAIISGGKGTAHEKLAVMEDCGIKVTRNPAEMGTLHRGYLPRASSKHQKNPASSAV